jgi:E3 ubiquitin-protein ligase HERC3
MSSTSSSSSSDHRVSMNIKSRIAALGLNEQSSANTLLNHMRAHELPQHFKKSHESMESSLPNIATITTSTSTASSVSTIDLQHHHYQQQQQQPQVQPQQQQQQQQQLIVPPTLKRRNSDNDVAQMRKTRNFLHPFRKRMNSLTPPATSHSPPAISPTTVQPVFINPVSTLSQQHNEALKPQVPLRRHTVDRSVPMSQMHSELANKLIKRASMVLPPSIHIEAVQEESVTNGFVLYSPPIENVTSEIVDTSQILAQNNLILVDTNFTDEQVHATIVFQKYTRRWLAKRRFKRIVKRKQCSLELLSTEKTYVDDIRLITQVFLEPMKRIAASSRPQITKEQISQIFSDIEVIFQVNTAFLNQLSTRLTHYSNYTVISDIVLSMAPFFKAYSGYCNNYQKSHSVLDELRKDSDTRSILSAMERDSRLSKGSLSSYLILPIQRIPRYRLLLQEVIKFTDKDQLEYKNLHDALASICKVADHLNSTMKVIDRTNEIIKIQNQFTQDILLVEAHRSFLQAGRFKEMKEVDGIWGPTGRVIALHLFSDILVVSYLTENERYQYKSEIKLRNALLLDFVVSEEDKNYLDDRLFRIESPEGRAICGAASIMEKNAWLKMLYKTISDNKATQKNNVLRVSARTLGETQSSPLALALSGESDDRGVPMSECLQLLKQGSTMLKYGNHGKPHFRTFVLTADERYIIWFSPNKSSKKSQVALSEVKQLITGQRTYVFQKHKSQDLETLSFSLVYGDDRTLDIVCKDKREYMNWVTGLQYISSYIAERKVSPTADKALEPIQFADVGQDKKKLKDEFERIGDLYSWGQGSRGALGHGNEDDQTVPLLVKDFLYMDVALAACSESATAVVALTGELFTFGCGEKGRLGHGDTCDRVRATLVKELVGHKIVQVAMGSCHTLVLDATGHTWVFGSSEFGQTGLGPTFVGQHVSVPTRIPALAHVKVTTVACGHSHSACITDGWVLMFGRGDDGQCGLGTKSNVDIPTVLTDLSHTRAHSVALGLWHSLILTDEGLYSVGNNSYGQLGLGNTEEALKAKRVDFFNNKTIVRIAAGSAHSACVLNTGEVYCFGYGIYGQIGSGDRSNSLNPVLVSTLANERVREIACGTNHTLCLTEKGHVYSYGAGSYGRLGLGDESDQATPKEITFFNDKTIRSIAAGGNQSVSVCAHQWVPDKDSTNCMHCHATFTFTRRRHHCRYCGGLFCGPCTTKRIAVLRFGFQKPVRVCDYCHSIISNRGVDIHSQP